MHNLIMLIRGLFLALIEVVITMVIIWGTVVASKQLNIDPSDPIEKSMAIIPIAIWFIQLGLFLKLIGALGPVRNSAERNYVDKKSTSP